MLLPSLLLVVCLARLTASVPTLAFPLADQVPPVARIGQVFDFTLLPGTFTANNISALSYAATGLPDWVSFNNVTLSFTGTPSSSSNAETSISLTATDTDGTAVTSSFDLIVSSNPEPTVHLSLPRQIAAPSLHAFSSAIPLASNAGIVIHPYWSFSIGFQMDTVRSSSGAPIYYSARQRGSASLPKWLEFHNDTMTFYGVAPINGSYTIVTTGSDYLGYSGAQTSFVIQVAGINNDSSGPLDFAPGTSPSNASLETVAGSRFEYEVDLEGVTIGGRVSTAAQREALTVTADISVWSWMSFDGTKLVGTVPQSYINGTTTPISIPITVANTTSGASVTSYLAMNVAPFLFSTFTLPNVTANPGQGFTFDLTKYITNTTGVTVNTTFSNGDQASEWLKFDSKSLELAGTVPQASDFTSRRRALGYDSISVAFHAAQGEGPVSTATLPIAIQGVTPAAPTSSSSPEPSGTGGAVPSSGGLSTAGKIALGVVLGLFGLVLIIALLVFCCIKRRRDAQTEAEEKSHLDDDADSFVAIGSPNNAQDPFSRRTMLNPIPHFSSIYIGRPSLSANDQRPGSGVSETKPKRMSAMRGIFTWGSQRESGMVTGDLGTLQEKDKSLPGMNGSGSLISSNGEIIRTEGFEDDESSFTHTFGSDSDSSRASWESRKSFRWSSAEGGSTLEHHQRQSSVPSVARPRQDFTPRYPRNGSPTAVAKLTRAPSSAGTHATFSEFASDEGHARSDSLSGSLPGSGSLGCGSLSGSGSLRSHTTFPNGPSGLGRFADDSQGFPSLEEEDEDSHSVDDTAIVTMAERQSFETRVPHRSTSTTSRPGQAPRLMPSQERFAYSPSQDQMPAGGRTPSLEALPVNHHDAFDDADEETRRSMIYAPAATDGQSRGLGYPASAIFFGSEPRSSMQPSESGAASEGRSSTIRVVPPRESVMSPPLPSVSSFVRHRRNATSTSTTGASVVSGTTNQDGRIMAVSNETFSIHPTINPPPTVSLSASTWSSNPPSTYRAESTDGKPLPTWLHFDSRELELWGVPGLANAGEFIHVRILEKTPNAKRRSDSSQWGFDPQTEREVGRCVIEVVDRIRSPQFALENSPHAL